MKWKVYQTEMVNSSKGEIYIPENSELKNILEANDFIKDAKTESFIRSSAIVKFEHVGFKETT